MKVVIFHQRGRIAQRREAPPSVGARSRGRGRTGEEPAHVLVGPDALDGESILVSHTDAEP